MSTFTYNGHTYLLTKAETWFQAQAEAQSLGGNLVTINDQAEQDWLTTTFGTGNLWIGYTDQETEGVWKWINGETSAYTNWNQGEPNNLGNEDFGVFWSNGKWNDWNGGNSAPGIIEINKVILPNTNWVDWVAKEGNNVSGNIALGTATVNVTFSGSYSFAQIEGGTDYWSPSVPYLSSAVTNAPPNSDIIGLSSGGTKTITFSQTVHNPVIGLVSWNGNTVDFGVPIHILSKGAGYYGSGELILNATGTGFYGNGEVHGVSA